MRITSEQTAFFKENGYAVLPGLVSETALSQMKQTLLILLQKYAPKSFSDFRGDDFIENEEFNARLIHFRKEKPHLFGAVYDSMQVSTTLQGFINSPTMVGCAAHFLNDDPEAIMSFNQALRMDAPGDTRNALDWHQDLITLDKKPDVSDGVTISVALHSLSSRMGSMMICPKSHLLGWVTDVVPKADHDTNYSNLYVVDPSIINQYTPVSIMANTGDAVIISMMVLHRSGMNESSRMRCTAIGRYFRFRSNNFIPGGMQFRPSRTTGL